MGSAGIFSTSGVLDSAGNAKVSFLAKKSENKQFTSLPHNSVQITAPGKESQPFAFQRVSNLVRSGMRDS